MRKVTSIFLATALVFPALLPAAPKPAANALAKKTHLFASIFNGRLLDSDGKPVTTDAIKYAEYKVVYFAKANPSCKAFTPKLVEYVIANRKEENFEVIFVSSDKTKQEMLDSMKEAKMPWAGTHLKGLNLDGLDAGAQALPCLRVFDTNGKMIIDTYDDAGKRLGPESVLVKFTKLLSKKSR